MKNEQQHKTSHFGNQTLQNVYKEIKDFPLINPLVFFSSEGKILFINKSFKNLSNLNESDSIFDFPTNPPLKEVLSQINNSFIRSVEFNITIPKSGSQDKPEFKALLSGIWTGQQLVFFLALDEIADGKKQLENGEINKANFEKEQRLNKLKSAFLANMSHEIRTPLNAVVGYSDLIAEEVNEQNYEILPEIISYMKDGVKRLLNLIDNIVEVSMIEANDYSVELSRESINQLIKETLNSFEEEAKRIGINFDIDLDNSNPHIKTDVARFKKIIEQLISNAIKYNHNNGIIMVKSSSDDKSVQIEITDSGIGIEEEKLKVIIEPFSQVEEEGYRRNYEGAGLGLTIAYNLTKLFKGTFDIHSRVNEGTTVLLTFPKDH